MTTRGAEKSRYVLRGGAQGRERLRILSRAMRPATLRLLEQAGIRPGMICLDIGCGGGDVSFDLARLVQPDGIVLALDVDEIKIEIARSEAGAQQITNIDFRVADLGEWQLQARAFDLAHARFVLSHLPNPAAVLAKMREALRPGGVVAIADTDFRGAFSEPETPALREFVDLYTRALARRGGDANIGPRLPALLAQNGFDVVHVGVVQNAAMIGESKLLPGLTMEYAADAVVAESVAAQADCDRIAAELYEFARDPSTVLSGPRVIEVLGRPLQ